jgi:copper oxidase (laccase) domain-containing protein
VIRPDGNGRWLFDLWEANRRQLRGSGVPERQIHTAELPTGAGSPFFSHRAEQPCGRFAAVARLRSTATS